MSTRGWFSSCFNNFLSVFRLLPSLWLLWQEAERSEGGLRRKWFIGSRDEELLDIIGNVWYSIAFYTPFYIVWVTTLTKLYRFLALVMSDLTRGAIWRNWKKYVVVNFTTNIEKSHFADILSTSMQYWPWLPSRFYVSIWDNPNNHVVLFHDFFKPARRLFTRFASRPAALLQWVCKSHPLVSCFINRYKVLDLLELLFAKTILL